MPKRTRKVSASRVVAADRQTIFDLVADPAMHAVIDGSGMVQDVQPNGPERLYLGAKFGMSMKLGLSYKILNTVVEFEEGRRIAWRHFHGHRWRYELEDTTTEDGRPATLVTEAFDWSQALTKIGFDLTGYPRRNLQAIRKTLVRLDDHLTSGT